MESIFEYINETANDSMNSKWINAAKLCVWHPPSQEYYKETEIQFRKRPKSSRYQKEFCKSFVHDCMRKYDMDFMIITTDETTMSLEEVCELFDIVIPVEFKIESNNDLKKFDEISKERVIETGIILTAPPNLKAYCLKLMPMIRKRLNIHETQTHIRELESYQWPSFSNQSIQMIGATAPKIIDPPIPTPTPILASQNSIISSFWTIISSLSTSFFSSEKRTNI
jgi:hypothetical protein